MPVPDIGEVRLLHYPVRLGMCHQEHVDELTREFQLMAAGGLDDTDVPARLVSMVRMLTGRFARELEEPARRRQDAADRGDPVVDLSYPAVPGAEEIVEGWARMMDEVDAYCRSGHLLALAAPDDLVVLRHWVTEEFRRQLRGERPRPWDGPLV